MAGKMRSYLYQTLYGARRSVVLLGERALVGALKLYYAAKDTARPTRAEDEELTRGIRNPVQRLVEFYVAFLWPGKALDVLVPLFALAIKSEKDKSEKKVEALVAALARVWSWSRFDAVKSSLVRSYAVTGDLFIKIVSEDTSENAAEKETPEPNRVYLQVLDPETITEITVNDRGVLQTVRIDVASTDETTGETRIHSERWSMSGVKIYHRGGAVTDPIKMFPAPSEEYSLDELGTPGYLPIVHAKFRDIGEDRGACSFWSAIDKIDEASILTSRMHAQLFRSNKATWALESVVKDTSGRVLPPPTLTTNSAGKIEMGGETFVSINGTLKCLVPDINFGAMLDIVNAQIEEIEKDLPELGLERALKASQIATETLRILFAPAVARILEARGNAEAALAQADLIALSMAQALSIDGFKETDIGTEFEHTFEPRDVLPLTQAERIAQTLAEVEIMLKKQDIGFPLAIVLAEGGYSEDEITVIKQAIDDEKEQDVTLAKTLLDAAIRKRDAE